MAVIASVTSLGSPNRVRRGNDHDGVVAGRLRQEEGAAANVVGGQNLALWHFARRLVRSDLLRGGVEAIGRVPEKGRSKAIHSSLSVQGSSNPQ